MMRTNTWATGGSQAQVAGQRVCHLCHPMLVQYELDVGVAVAIADTRAGQWDM